MFEQQFGDFVGHFLSSRLSGASRQFRARPAAFKSRSGLGASSVVAVWAETRGQSRLRSIAHTGATSGIGTIAILKQTADSAKRGPRGVRRDALWHALRPRG